MTDEQQSSQQQQVLTQLVRTRWIALAALAVGIYGIYREFGQARLEAKSLALTSNFDTESGQCVLAGSKDGLVVMFTDGDMRQMSLGLAFSSKERELVVRDGDGNELRRISLDAK